MTNDELSHLLRQAAGNPQLDPASYDRLTRELLTRCRQFLHGMRLEPAARDDLLQELVIHVLKQLGKQRGLEKPLAWLKCVLRNRFLEDRRSYQGWRRRYCPADEIPEADERAMNVTAPLPVECTAEVRRLERALIKAADAAGESRQQVEAWIRMEVWGETAVEIASELARTGSAPRANKEAVWKWSQRAIRLIESLASKSDDPELKGLGEELAEHEQARKRCSKKAA